jgi:hypothetical protein
MIRPSILVVILAVGAPAMGRAQTQEAPRSERATANLPLSSPPVVSRAPDSRSPIVAFTLSLSGELLGVGAFYLAVASNSDKPLFVAVPALIFGPSAGELYAGASTRGWLLSGARAACVSAFVLAMTRGHLAGDVAHDKSWAEPLQTASIAGFVILSFVSIIDSPLAANRFNRSHAASHLALGPWVVPPVSAGSTTKGTGAGLALGGIF